MNTAIFPLAFASDEMRLLTAVVIGFLFGFSLERAGFGNARKLVGQFYLYDMTVFKVMFTAVLVAMVGLYSLSAFGVVNLALIWINPTFVWAQLVGGFLLGVGFIMSGLCPGTSVVSAASGRWDGLVTLGGIFVGSLLFAVVIDLFPVLERLYEGGSMGTSLLPQLLGVPVPWFMLGVVVFAGAAFAGAEALERKFQQKQRPVELTPAPTRRAPRYKFALAGGLALVAIVASGASAPGMEREEVPMAQVEPLDLAEAIIANDPNLLILDVRGGQSQAHTERIPGSVTVSLDSSALAVLSVTAPGTEVVVYDAEGVLLHVPEGWPVGRFAYRVLRGGFEGWRSDVLTPAEAGSFDSAEHEFVERQNQIAAFFSGAAVRPSAVIAPPVVQLQAAPAKKKAMGC